MTLVEWFRASLIAVVVLPVLSGVVLASDPIPPVQIVWSSQGVGLDYDVITDTARVAQVSAKASLQQAGRELQAAELPARTLATPAALSSAGDRITGPVPTLLTLGSGVYAHVVEVQVQMRGVSAAAKTLRVRATRYFRIANGVPRLISSEEYTEAVQPSLTFTGSDGLKHVEHGGHALIEPGVKRAAKTPIGRREDEAVTNIAANSSGHR